MKISTYFKHPKSNMHKRYEAIRSHILDGTSLLELARKYGLSHSYLIKFKNKVVELLQNGFDPFFVEQIPGPKRRHKADFVRERIIALRQANHSIVDIRAALASQNYSISLHTIHNVLKEEGFSRLPRRSHNSKKQLSVPDTLTAPKSAKYIPCTEEFSTAISGGLFVFMPLIERLGIIEAIKDANFPSTQEISSVSYILSFLALKLIGNTRLSHDENWSLDRALGLFSGLNVLPKSASLSSYSYRITRECNKKFLIALSRIFDKESRECEFNLDFKTIPHWGDISVLEKNYATTRGKSVKSVLALIVQNVSHEKLAYTNAEITHDTSKDAVIEFVDFWRDTHHTCPKMLVFDSQFTIYENLSKLNRDGIKFLTLRQRRAKMLQHARSIPRDKWQEIEVESGKRKPRKVEVYDETIQVNGYDQPMRQLIILDHSKEHIFMLTNDFETSPIQLIRKYGRRWLVEQEIAEQISFFHLNQLSSSIVVKVDFDLTLTLLAHNLYRALSTYLPRYEKCTVNTICRCFLGGRASIKTTKKDVRVTLYKRSHLPLLFEIPWMKEQTHLSWLGLNIGFEMGTSS